ncbi:MAG: hypothetical protein ACFE8M_07840 [Candidatus Hermodarchaeota archaeon]
MGFEIEKKKRNKLIAVVVLLVSCILLMPVLNDFTAALGLGHYNTNNNFNISFSGGTGGLHVDFDLQLTSDERHTGTITCRTISSGSVQQIGITYISYTISRETQPMDHFTNSYDPPLISFQRTHINLRCYKDSEIRCTGSANVKFLVGEIEQEGIIDFVLSITITFSSGESSYYWRIAEVWLVILDAIGIIVLIITLAKIIRGIQFDKWYTEEHRKEDEEFFEKIRQNLRLKKEQQ